VKRSSPIAMAPAAMTRVANIHKVYFSIITPFPY
jgi:hypothetical protein